MTDRGVLPSSHAQATSVCAFGPNEWRRTRMGHLTALSKSAIIGQRAVARPRRQERLREACGHPRWSLPREVARSGERGES
ncbi:hypothetical protein MRX96_017203 [Rhipicephalus microplus]